MHVYIQQMLYVESKLDYGEDLPWKVGWIVLLRWPITGVACCHRVSVGLLGWPGGVVESKKHVSKGRGLTPVCGIFWQQLMWSSS